MACVNTVLSVTHMLNTQVELAMPAFTSKAQSYQSLPFASTYEKMSPQQDVTQLALRHVLHNWPSVTCCPAVSYVAYALPWSVTDDDR